MELMEVPDMNYNDGSFTFAKVLSEFGYFGVAAWAFAIYLLVHMIRRGRRDVRIAPSMSALTVSGVTVVVLGGFIRGTSYFSGPFVFGVYCLLISLKNGASVSQQRECNSVRGVSP